MGVPMSQCIPFLGPLDVGLGWVLYVGRSPLFRGSCLAPVAVQQSRSWMILIQYLVCISRFAESDCHRRLLTWVGGGGGEHFGVSETQTFINTSSFGAEIARSRGQMDKPQFADSLFGIYVFDSSLYTPFSSIPDFCTFMLLDRMGPICCLKFLENRKFGKF